MSHWLPAWLRNAFTPHFLYSDEMREIVFEGRHKSYGAYALRRAYPRNVARAALLALAMLLLVLSLPTIFSKKPLPALERMTEVRLDAPPQLDIPKVRSEPPAKPKQQQSRQRPATRVARDEDLPNPPKDASQEVLPSDTTAKTPSDVAGSLGDETGDAEGPPVFDFVDVMPSFPGGDRALSQHIHSKLLYPPEAARAGVEGVVLVSFVVDAYGKVRQPRVIRSLGPACDEEALRVVRTIPDWIPGNHRGRRVSVQFRLPIEFKLRKH
ncbi:MAG: energy transducer TonB [Saprospiraceae bacterium]|nr:energy transducer TonB [Saprospiraceae bacterium]